MRTAALCGVPKSELLAMTMRELVVTSDAVLLEKWDHTASVTAYLQNIASLVSNFGSSKRPQLASFFDEHPLRDRLDDPSKIRVTKENFKETFLSIFLAMAKGKQR